MISSGDDFPTWLGCEDSDSAAGLDIDNESGVDVSSSPTPASCADVYMTGYGELCLLLSPSLTSSPFSLGTGTGLSRFVIDMTFFFAAVCFACPCRVAALCARSGDLNSGYELECLTAFGRGVEASMGDCCGDSDSDELQVTEVSDCRDGEESMCADTGVGAFGLTGNVYRQSDSLYGLVEMCGGEMRQMCRYDFGSSCVVFEADGMVAAWM
jgi:hypothetical protein